MPNSLDITDSHFNRAISNIMLLSGTFVVCMIDNSTCMYYFLTQTNEMYIYPNVQASWEGGLPEAREGWKPD